MNDNSPFEPTPDEQALSQNDVVVACSARWGAPASYHDTPYWVGSQGACLIACLSRAGTPVLRVHSTHHPLVHFIEVGHERHLRLALLLLRDFQPCDRTLGPPAELCLDQWECLISDSWGKARAARQNSVELRAWSRALHATAAIAARVSASLASALAGASGTHPVPKQDEQHRAC